MSNIQVQIVYALPETQDIIALLLPQGSTVKTALEMSGVLSKYAELNLETIQVGIFSQKVALSDLLNNGDRIEIYRDLHIDPKTARRKRVKK